MIDFDLHLKIKGTNYVHHFKVVKDNIFKPLFFYDICKLQSSWSWLLNCFCANHNYFAFILKFLYKLLIENRNLVVYYILIVIEIEIEINTCLKNKGSGFRVSKSHDSPWKSSRIIFTVSTF